MEPVSWVLFEGALVGSVTIEIKFLRGQARLVRCALGSSCRGWSREKGRSRGRKMDDERVVDGAGRLNC